MLSSNPFLWQLVNQLLVQTPAYYVGKPRWKRGHAWHALKPDISLMDRFIEKPLGIPPDSRILVRANNWIGDVVISSPAIHALRSAYPQALISVLAKPWVIPVLKFNPHIDQIVLYDAHGRHQGLSGNNRLAKDLMLERFQASILFQRAFEAAWISFRARIPVRAGYRTDGRGLLLTHGIRARKEDFEIHRVEHNLRMLLRLGVPEVDKRLVLPVGSGETERALKILRDLGIRVDNILFGINPGATFGTAKRWSHERFAALADRLASHYGAQGLILGSAVEHELGETITAMTSSSSLFNLAGKTSLGEAMALIGLCGLFVTNDSGLMHIAAAADVPLVAIFGPTKPGNTSPWCARQRLLRREGIACSPCMKRTCREEEHLCMDAILLEDVFSACQELESDFGVDTVEKRAEGLVTANKPVKVLEFG